MAVVYTYRNMLKYLVNYDHAMALEKCYLVNYDHAMALDKCYLDSIQVPVMNITIFMIWLCIMLNTGWKHMCPVQHTTWVWMLNLRRSSVKFLKWISLFKNFMKRVVLLKVEPSIMRTRKVVVML